MSWLAALLSPPGPQADFVVRQHCWTPRSRTALCADGIFRRAVPADPPVRRTPGEPSRMRRERRGGGAARLRVSPRCPVEKGIYPPSMSRRSRRAGPSGSAGRRARPAGSTQASNASPTVRSSRNGSILRKVGWSGGPLEPRAIRLGVEGKHPRFLLPSLDLEGGGYAVDGQSGDERRSDVSRVHRVEADWTHPRRGRSAAARHEADGGLSVATRSKAGALAARRGSSCEVELPRLAKGAGGRRAGLVLDEVQPLRAKPG